MEKQVLHQLIDLFFSFSQENEGKPYSIADFSGFLNARLNDEKIEFRTIAGEETPDLQELRQENNSDISILITLMFRYAKHYIKKALQGSPIQTADEFAYLITLMTYPSLTKTELILKQVMEKTSGVEVIKRLISQGLIMEFADENDKRSVRVALTDKGKQELGKVLPNMALATKIVAGNLTASEINTLSYLLKKLDFYHNDIYLNRRNASLEEIVQ